MNTPLILSSNGLIEEAHERYQELVWRVNFLRTLSAQPDPEPTKEDIVKWHQTIKSAQRFN